MKKYDWSKERIQEAISKSDSYSETLRNLGISTSGNNSETLKRKIEEYNLDISHFTFGNQYVKGLNNIKYVPASEYLGTGKTIATSKLKEKLLKEGYVINKCDICGIEEWNNKPIICQLHHIDGNPTNNVLSNFQMLCPNCHSQTENYCGSATKKAHFYCKDCGAEISRGATYCVKCKGKHRRKVSNRPNKEELISLYKEHKSFRAIGELYGVSDKAISKWYKAEGLPYKAKELKELCNS